MPEDEVTPIFAVATSPQSVLSINSQVTLNRHLAGAEAVLRSIRHGGSPVVLRARLTAAQVLQQQQAGRALQQDYLTHLIHDKVAVDKVLPVSKNLLENAMSSPSLLALTASLKVEVAGRHCAECGECGVPFGSAHHGSCLTNQVLNMAGLDTSEKRYLAREMIPL